MSFSPLAASWYCTITASVAARPPLGSAAGRSKERSLQLIGVRGGEVSPCTVCWDVWMREQIVGSRDPGRCMSRARSTRGMAYCMCRLSLRFPSPRISGGIRTFAGALSSSPPDISSFQQCHRRVSATGKQAFNVRSRLAGPCQSSLCQRHARARL